MVNFKRNLRNIKNYMFKSKTCKSNNQKIESIHYNPIIKYLSLFILPYIILYSLYIQISGENSPGGGFSAGVIFASGIILRELISNKTILNNKIYIDFLLFTSVVGIMIYMFTGIVSLLFDDHYLNYYSLDVTKLRAQHIGIFLVELGVGLTVSSTMCLIYAIASAND